MRSDGVLLFRDSWAGLGGNRCTAAPYLLWNELLRPPRFDVVADVGVDPKVGRAWVDGALLGAHSYRASLSWTRKLAAVAAGRFGLLHAGPRQRCLACRLGGKLARGL